MIRLWVAVIILAGIVHFGITVWRKMERKEQLTLTKSVGYSIIVSLLVLTTMTAIVVLF